MITGLGQTVNVDVGAELGLAGDRRNLNGPVQLGVLAAVAHARAHGVDAALGQLERVELAARHLEHARLVDLDHDGVVEAHAQCRLLALGRLEPRAVLQENAPGQALHVGRLEQLGLGRQRGDRQRQLRGQKRQPLVSRKKKKKKKKKMMMMMIMMMIMMTIMMKIMTMIMMIMMMIMMMQKKPKTRRR